MKIAVLGSIGNDTDKLSSVLDEIKQRDCEMIFALGNYTTPAVFKQLANAELPIYAVFGDADEGKESIEGWVREEDRDISIRREMNRVKLEEDNFATTYFKDISGKLEMSGMYKGVFFAEGAEASQKLEDETLIASPGAVSDGSFGIYDTEGNEFEVVKV